MSKHFGYKENRKKALKELIKKLHEGARPQEVKEEFKEVLASVTSAEIAQIEEELVKEGMPREEIHRLCEVHLAVFKESLEKERTLAPEGHPIHILMEEHKMLLKFADELKNTAQQVKQKEDFSAVTKEMAQISHIEQHLKESESHYVREENVLFPYLEKHGVTQPPAIMWMEHDKIREIKKNLYRLLDGREGMGFQDFARQLEEVALSLADMLTNHFYKENNILFPTALKVMDEDEWREARRQFDEIGYCCFTPQPARVPMEEKAVSISKPKIKGAITLDTGTLSHQELEAILDTLPVDVTFVDKDNSVRYFNQSKERIFPRTKAVIGRKVQQCHPQKSLHVVNQILEDFRNGKRDVAEFWINLNDRLIHIRYFPVRDKNGAYLGCLEVTQDITDIQKIEGEKRLL